MTSAGQTRCQIFLGIVMLASAAVRLHGAQVSLSWTAPTNNTDGTPLADLAGYAVHYGLQSGVYSQSIDVGDTTTASMSGLDSHATYYISVKAYNAGGIESDFAGEVAWCFDSDVDDLPDAWEMKHFAGLDAKDGGPAEDFDHDGVCNRDEFVAGTDPTDPADAARLEIATADGEPVCVSFVALKADGAGYEGSSRYYTLEQCQDLRTATWIPVSGFEDLLASGQTVAYAPEAAASTCFSFFRTRIRLNG